MLGVEQPLATEPVEAHATVPVVERAEWNDPRVIAPLVAGADVMHLCRSTADDAAHRRDPRHVAGLLRSEEHTSELQSLMRISYAVFCLKKKKQKQPTKQNITT